MAASPRISSKETGNHQYSKQRRAMFRIRAFLFPRMRESPKSQLLSSDSLQRQYVSAPSSQYYSSLNLIKQCSSLRGSNTDKHQCVLLF